MAVESRGELHALPEDCIANTLSLTSPKDVCRLSLVASTFLSASQSDVVWERFLPPDYRDIISRAVGGPDSLLDKFHSKKDLYLHLCDHSLLIDGGRKSFSLEKLSGKKCYMLAAREISIVWGDAPEYWRWISLPESRFFEVAELLNVCWFEIKGKINTSMLSSGTNYAAYLVFTTKATSYGFESYPAEAFVAVDGHKSEKRSIWLEVEGVLRQRHPMAAVGRWLRNYIPAGQNTEYPKRRDDGWMEVELGEYFVEGGENGDLVLSLLDVKGGNWKYGIIIQGIEIRPKDGK